ncbi:MAG: excinuclease ABC subunit UvrA [Acholeplasmatales bacterium]|nr:excinuclease ABC subunit UvrA [Acholeplasmatales bacterium]
MDKIIIHGARENNLKNIDLELPKNKLIVMTGLSGSGKSTLAFDTIYQEGERRFIESLSASARQFIGSGEKPDVDSIEGLSPAISIDQKTTSKNPRSTVGTITEIYDYFRVLYARIGTPYCPIHNIPIDAQTVDQMADRVLKIEENKKVYILSPIVKQQRGSQKNVFEKFLKEGYVRAYVDGALMNLDEEIDLNKNLKHDVDIVIERFKMHSGLESRIRQALELALEASGGYAKVRIEGEDDLFFSEHYACKICGYSVPKLEPRLFSFNSPLGACPSCNGLGVKLSVSEDLIVDPEKSIKNGALLPMKNQEKDNIANSELEQVCSYYDIDMNIPFGKLPRYKQEIVLFQSPDVIEFNTITSSGNIKHDKKKYEGIINNFSRRYVETTSDWIRSWIEGYMVETECEACHQARLNPQVLSIKIDNKSIYDICNMPIDDLYVYLKNLKLSAEKAEIARLALKEVCDRLEFLKNVGLGYLTLSRSADTLSGGEAQRIRLATQIGSKLTGVLYVLDEPSIGLHQRDNDRLIATMKEMRDLGNTLIVVEHDLDTMAQSDYLVDIGPGAGIHGGEVVAAGTPEEVKANPASLTGRYLSGKEYIALPAKREKGNGKKLSIINATEHNLKNVSVDIPLGCLVLVTGVSGSGKSTLINEVLFKNLYTHIYKARGIKPGKCKEIKGISNIDKIIQISQTPIGRTPRSNPATYTGVFDDIRDIFASTSDAKIRGYDKGRFSFNVKGGRCEACWGDGVKRVSMQFLPDVYVPCEECHGKRYNRETLEVKFKGKTISDVLDMTIEEAYDFFDAVPRIKTKLKTLLDVGLGYIKLGQSSTTLSGGEAQRVKLASELHRKITPGTLYIMDEPTTGLHTEDIKKLMNVIFKIRDAGASIVIIEHNLDVIKLADYIIDLGPEGGDAGGSIVVEGTPEIVAKCEESFTGKYLKNYLK